MALFRVRGCEVVAEDLAQEVMLTVYRKADHVRDRELFRAWVFTIARNALSRDRGKRAREVHSVELGEGSERFVASNNQSAVKPAFEFHRWMTFLDSWEQEALTLRFVEECEYHEIAAAQAPRSERHSGGCLRKEEACAARENNRGQPEAHGSLSLSERNATWLPYSSCSR